MKKKQVYSILIILIILLMAPLLNQLSNGPTMPFKSLSVDNIKSIDLYLQPPNSGQKITDENTLRKIVEILNKLVIENEESPKVDYNSQLVSYTLSKDNGDVVEIKIYSPYVMIDGKTYKAKYEACDVLNLLGNDLLENNK